MARLVATFSYSPGSSAMISIAPEGNDWSPVATARPSAGARPLVELAAMGYRLAHSSQRHYSLGPTMAATGYAKLAVVPI